MPDRVLKGRRGHARVAVLTVISEEFEAVQAELNAYEEVGVTGVFAPVKGEIQADGTHYFPFVLAQCAARSNVPATHKTRELLEHFRPEVVLLVGIAGGIRRLPREGVDPEGPLPGDVVIAEYVHYSEFTKNVASGHFLRYFPLDHPSSSLLSAHASAVVRARPGSPEWFADLKVPRPGAGDPRHFVGEIVATEAIAGDPGSERQYEILSRFDNALAVDMESMGVAKALHQFRDEVHYNPKWMCIRGISDSVTARPRTSSRSRSGQVTSTVEQEGENDDQRAKWKAYAAAIASRYAKLILERLLREERPAIAGDPGAPAYNFNVGPTT